MVNSTAKTQSTSSPPPVSGLPKTEPDSLPLNNNNNNNNTSTTSTTSTSGKKRGTITEFVESSFASIERLCNPISNAVEDLQTAQKNKMKSKNNTNSAAGTATGAGATSQEGNSNKSKTSSSSSNRNNNNSNNNSNSKLDDEDEDDEAYATLTYLALLTSLYLPLLLFLWIRRSIFGTASLCRSLFLGHMLRLVLAFMLLPPSTTKSFVPTWLWNFGVAVGTTAERLWNDKRTQAMIPTWFHLVLAFLLGIENENVPSSAALANLGSNNEKDTWPPPALVVLGIFTFTAFVVHPDGLTWIMLAQIKNWILETFEKTTEGIRMIKDGTIKITLAEISGVIAGIIIIVTIVRAILSQLEPTEKVRTPHREKRHKHRKGKKGKGGRHHHNNHNHNTNHNQKTSTSEGNGGKGRIRSGNYRASNELYESTPRSRSPSPSGRARSDSDMEDTTVSAISDSGNATFENATKQTAERKTLKSISKTENTSSDVELAQNKTSKQVHPPARENRKVGVNPKSDQAGKKTSKQSPARENKKAVLPPSSPLSGQTCRRTQMSTSSSGEKQKRGHGRKGKKSKHHNNPNVTDSSPKSDGMDVKMSTANRQVKSNPKPRKNNRDDRQHNKNLKSRETECDATVGSTSSSYGNSDYQSYSNSIHFSSHQATAPIHENQNVHEVTHNRRRSFTDPNSSLYQSQINGSPSAYHQTLSMAERNVVTPPSQMSLLSPEKNDSISFQQTQRGSQNTSFTSSYSSNINEGLYMSNMVGDASQRNEVGLFSHNHMPVQLDVHRVNQNAGHASHGSPNLRGLNGSVIRPPPGLAPSQNPVGSSSVFGHDFNDRSQKSLPSLSSSTMSVYSNFSSNASRDMAFNTSSQSCGEQSSTRNVALPPISPIHRNAPAPIGHERAMKSNDEEIEADLLALGGQMAGSILDF